MKIIHGSLKGLLNEVKDRKVEAVRVAGLMQSDASANGIPRYTSWIVVSAPVDWDQWVEWRHVVGRGRADVGEEGAQVPEKITALMKERLAEVRERVTEAWRLLQGHPWPGNVRELGNAVSRAVIFGAGGWIQPGDLQLRQAETFASPSAERAAAPAADLDLSLRQREALDLAARHGSVRRADLVSRFRISGEAARRDLAGLVRVGLLQRRRLRGIALYVLADRPAGPGG